MTINTWWLFKRSYDDYKTALRRTKSSRRRHHKILPPWICFGVKIWPLMRITTKNFFNGADYYIILFFSAEANWHENVRQAIVCKRRGFNGVVRYTSTVYDLLIFWTLRLDKFQGLIIVSLHAYLVEIAMLRLAVRLERCNTMDFIFLNAETLL